MHKCSISSRLDRQSRPLQNGYVSAEILCSSHSINNLSATTANDDDVSPSKNQANEIDTLSTAFIPRLPPHGRLHTAKEASPASSSENSSAPSTNERQQQKKTQHILSNGGGSFLSASSSSRRLNTSHGHLNSSSSSSHGPLNSSHLRLHNRQGSMGTVSGSATPSTMKRHYEESSGIGSQASSIERMPPPPPLSRQSHDNTAALPEVGIVDIRDSGVPHGTYIFA